MGATISAGKEWRAGNQRERTVAGAYLESRNCVGRKIIVGVDKVVLGKCRDGEQEKWANEAGFLHKHTYLKVLDSRGGSLALSACRMPKPAETLLAEHGFKCGNPE